MTVGREQVGEEILVDELEQCITQIRKHSVIVHCRPPQSRHHARHSDVVRSGPSAEERRDRRHPETGRTGTDRRGGCTTRTSILFRLWTSAAREDAKWEVNAFVAPST
eukprot:Selendium_serpulae@DN655_c0_g1_i2.p2